MGFDTGRELHVVSRSCSMQATQRREVVHIGAHRDYADSTGSWSASTSQLAWSMRCRIPRTRGFAKRHERGLAELLQRASKGSPKWDPEQHIVQENRTAALDLSRSVSEIVGSCCLAGYRSLMSFASTSPHDVKRRRKTPIPVRRRIATSRSGSINSRWRLHTMPRGDEAMVLGSFRWAP